MFRSVLDVLTYEQCFALVLVLSFVVGVLLDRTMIMFCNSFVFAEDEDEFTIDN